MATVRCPECGSGNGKRIRVAVGYVLIVFGILLIMYLMNSDLNPMSGRGMGNLLVGVCSVAYGVLVLWRRKYKCMDCGTRYRLR